MVIGVLTAMLAILVVGTLLRPVGPPPSVEEPSSCLLLSGDPTLVWGTAAQVPTISSFSDLTTFNDKGVSVRGVLSIQFGAALKLSGTHDSFRLFEFVSGRFELSRAQMLLLRMNGPLDRQGWLDRSADLNGRCAVVEGTFRRSDRAGVLGELDPVIGLAVWDQPRLDGRIPSIFLTPELPPSPRR